MARIRGITAQMNTFQFFFGLKLLLLILDHTDALSKTLQRKTTTTAEGQALTASVIQVLQSIRTEEAFTTCWTLVTQEAGNQQVSAPTLPRRRRAGARLDQGRAAPEYHTTPCSWYRQHYYETLDTVMGTIRERFTGSKQDGLAKCEAVSGLLLQAMQPNVDAKDLLAKVLNLQTFYPRGFPDGQQLTAHLRLLSMFLGDAHQQTNTVGEILTSTRGLSTAAKSTCQEAIKLCKTGLNQPLLLPKDSQHLSACAGGQASMPPPDLQLIQQLEARGLCIHKVRGDGHCLLNAFVKAWPGPAPTELNEGLMSEVMDNMEEYRQFLPSLSPEMIIEELESYLNPSIRNYNSDTCDIVLTALVNAFQVYVELIVSPDKHHLTMLSFIPRGASSVCSRPAYLLQTGSGVGLHFDVLISV